MPRRIPKRERERLEKLIQYLNLEEMRIYCAAHELPLYIHIELPDGRLRRTGDRDRKDIVLARILQFAVHGKRTGPTVYPKNVVPDGPLPKRLTGRVRVHFGQYEKKNEHFVQTMKELTGGAFRLGMIARLVLRDFWTAGVAPTLRQFADEWVRATAAHTGPRPEGAYVADLVYGTAGDNWKELRIQNAKEALAMLAELQA